MPPFTTRPFPPPSLSGVPVEYVVEQLHDLADLYWDKPDTADCTIIVPFPHGQPCLPAMSSISVLQPSFSIGTSFDQVNLAGRRATAPPLNAVPRVSMQLHIDYLSAHSSYLRGLFSGALPIDLMYSSAPPASNSGIPPERLPRLMPSSPDHPILFLPVPDPSSFYLLVHWMYFGDFTAIQECLHKGAVQWEGIARNAEYLGLNADLKIFLGNWYRAWLDPDRADGVSEGHDSDTMYSDSDEDDDCSTASEDEMSLSDTEDVDLKPRTRADFTSQPLSTPLIPSPTV